MPQFLLKLKLSTKLLSETLRFKDLQQKLFTVISLYITIIKSSNVFLQLENFIAMEQLLHL